MTLNLTKPTEGDTNWSASVNQNFTDIETVVNALGSGDLEVLDVQDSTSAGSMTFSVPANTLDTDEQSLLVFAGGTLDDASETISVSFGGATVFSCVVSTDLNGGGWFLIGLLTRLGASSQVFNCLLAGAATTSGSNTLVGRSGSRGAAAVSLTNAQNLVVTAAGESDDTVKFLHVSKLGAP